MSTAQAVPTRLGPLYLAGVDGGGTGTRARLLDREGRLLGAGEAGPSGLGQGVEQAWRHVMQALHLAFGAAALAPAAPSDIALGLGLAGAGVPAQRAAFLAADPGFALCALENDGFTQLLGAFAGGAGIVVAAGTGSVAACCDAQGGVQQCGGWGFPVGDEGSGAWLGLRAMGHAQAVLDGRAIGSGLSEAVFNAIGRDAPALLAWCARAGARAYAELAPCVFAAAEQGDAVALALRREAAAELLRLVQALDDCAVPLPVVASGSVGQRLVQAWPDVWRERLVTAAGDSVDGALLLVRRSLQAAV